MINIFHLREINRLGEGLIDWNKQYTSL